jgi:dCMP deaminase
MLNKKWQTRFFERCDAISLYSKDKSRKVGCVIVNEDRREIIAEGYNGFPRGVNDDIDKRHDRPEKYHYTEHAERNALFSCAFNGKSTNGTVLFCNLFPCSNCMRAIIQCGIKTIYIINKPNLNDSKYGESFQIATIMAVESNITIVYYEK